MPEAIVSGALLIVLEDVIGFVDFLEPVFAVLVAGIAVGMPLHRQFAKRGFEFRVGGGAGDFERLVIAALGHQSPALTKTSSPEAPSASPRTRPEADPHPS